MCQAMLDRGEFDPELCPLLKGLSPEQIVERMKQQPIASCRSNMLADANGRKDIICPAEALGAATSSY
jgi:hypothetical protein